jgi:DNA mismatch repair protein MLH3
MESRAYSAERAQLAKLDEQTRARIRSTQILTTLPQIVSELLQNSIDAKANNISVGVNCAEWTCWVRDDGSGISKRDLETFSEEDGIQRYCELT